jgi:hypothetical protein
MTRRTFFHSALAAVLAPATWAARQAAPRRFIEALRTRFYSGRVVKLDKTKLSQGPWAG